MNPATFADANPLTPRTPQSIREEFDRRRQVQVCSSIRYRSSEAVGGHLIRLVSRASAPPVSQAAMAEDDSEGLERVKKWLKSIYIFGLFESLDGAVSLDVLTVVLAAVLTLNLEHHTPCTDHAVIGFGVCRMRRGICDQRSHSRSCLACAGWPSTRLCC